MLGFFCSRRICYCSLGFPRSLQADASKDQFLLQVSSLQDFLSDPWGIRAHEATATVQVAVPKVVPPPPPPPHPAAVVDAFAGLSSAGRADGVDDSLAAVSAQAKRAALQKKAAAAMVAAEDYARRFESGDLVVSVLPAPF